MSKHGPVKKSPAEGAPAPESEIRETADGEAGDELIFRMLGLKDEGLTFKELAETLNKAGTKMASGRVWTARTARDYLAGHYSTRPRVGSAKHPSLVTLKQKREHAVKFDENRVELSKLLNEWIADGKSTTEIAEMLNKDGFPAKNGGAWSRVSVHYIATHPNPPPSREDGTKKNSEKKRKVGARKGTDLNLEWAGEQFPHLSKWVELARAWVLDKEDGTQMSIKAANTWVAFVDKNELPVEPAELLLQDTDVPDFYLTAFGKKRKKGNVEVNNAARNFLSWVLSQQNFCEEDDNGRLVTSPAFRNPIPRLNTKGLHRYDESVRSTLPYGYIDELRRMIAQGPDFRDWTWAQNVLGVSIGDFCRRHGYRIFDEDESKMLAAHWYQVSPEIIDKDDPDCVWRTRTKLYKNEKGSTSREETETIYEMWSPVRWVALLLKLQLPLRTHQVRMLDSGEADTLRWERGEWTTNTHPLAQGSEGQPYSNGIFRPSNRISDNEVKVLLHINTNKTADRMTSQTGKGYDVPWLVGGPQHQDPFYWMEKLRRWQEKYNPIEALVKWSELDGRHIEAKSKMQLAHYPDTAFLFRIPEDRKRPDFPPNKGLLERIWHYCLYELQQRLEKRGERLANGNPIQLVPATDDPKNTSSTTFFPLHSLRVSLITALAVEGEVPLVILQKIAGHSRLVMTLYYSKPGAKQAQRAIQAGVERLNENAEATTLDWLANAEFADLIKQVIANNMDTFRAAVNEEPDLRVLIGWLAMTDGWCLVGGNFSQSDLPGCHNGGALITAMPLRYGAVVGGARNCPMCRWFVTMTHYLPQLAARWNVTSYRIDEAGERMIQAEQRFKAIDDERAAACEAGTPFKKYPKYKEAQRAVEDTVEKFGTLTQTLSAITRLIERCRDALQEGDGSSLVAAGGLAEFEYAIEEVDSELMQVSGVCETTLNYRDFDPGKAVLRQSQLLDGALTRDKLPPLFLTLTEEEQQLVAHAFMQSLARQANPKNPALGRYKVINIIDARKSLVAEFGDGVADALNLATEEGAPHRVISIKSVSKLEKA